MGKCNVQVKDPIHCFNFVYILLLEDNSLFDGKHCQLSNYISLFWCNACLSTKIIFMQSASTFTSVDMTEVNVEALCMKIIFWELTSLEEQRLYGLFTWLSLVMSLMVSYLRCPFPHEMSWMSHFMRIFLPTFSKLSIERICRL